ncbi:pilus assembly protein [Clostridium sp. SYSU_GA19001]|uniref:TadE/TadG family type IV pilus assembly protein n=1 Tax=Clostridium caldaquaticum TaxID=2940653 RepID=UPI002076FB3E|nr:TadE/TadG family type IV pilus assembly protein [Clostridium caldaquaticum]MCM8710241.1 pilus assembly protein [Clostridium caldaquaticum]
MLKNLKNKKGQALVEFAIILPLLLLLIMGIVQFSMIINSYLSIQNAAREGARAGILGSSDIEIKNIIKAVSPSLEASNLTVTITPTESSRKSGDTLTVKIDYNYPLIVPIISSIFNDVVTLSTHISMRIE